MNILFDFFRSAKKSRLVLVSSGYLAGALANQWPLWAMVFGIAAVTFALIRQAWKMFSVPGITDDEVRLFLLPDSSAEARVREANEDFLVCQSAVEILAHPSLSTRKGFTEFGWDPARISVISTGTQFDAREILERIGGETPGALPNGDKYCLVDHNYSGSDAPSDLSLTVSETKFFTTSSVHRKIEHSPPLRRELGSLDPATNKIVGSLCLHFVVRFSDGSILFLKNSKRKEYARGLWSLSAEENMNSEDVRSGNGDCGGFFRRAVAEEVFGLTDGPTSERWQLIKESVGNMRIWSVFVEEKLNNFCLLGMAQLTITPGQLHEWRRHHRDKIVSDNEGSFYFITLSGLEAFLRAPTMTATGIFSQDKAEIHASDLHDTSRYRIFRTLRALKNKSLF